MLKERLEQINNNEKRKERLTQAMQVAEASKGVGLHEASLATPNKTSSHSANVTLGEDPATTHTSKSKGSGFKDDKNNTTHFASVQDNMKELNALIKGVSTNLFKGFEEEGVAGAFSKETNNNNEDDVHVTKLKKNLKVTKEACRFAKEINDDDRAPEKLKTILKLEDEIEKSCNN